MAVGDEQAAVAFVRRYQRRAFGLAMSMLGDAQAAEDVAQEALLRVWRHAPVFDARRGSAATWVLAITRNPGGRRAPPSPKHPGGPLEPRAVETGQHRLVARRGGRQLGGGRSGPGAGPARAPGRAAPSACARGRLRPYL